MLGEAAQGRPPFILSRPIKSKNELFSSYEKIDLKFKKIKPFHLTFKQQNLTECLSLIMLDWQMFQRF